MMLLGVGKFILGRSPCKKAVRDTGVDCVYGVGLSTPVLLQLLFC